VRKENGKNRGIKYIKDYIILEEYKYIYLSVDGLFID